MSNLDEQVYDLQERVSKLELRMDNMEKATADPVAAWTGVAWIIKFWKWIVGVLLVLAATVGLITGKSSGIPMIGE
jgi:hypothetical protein